MLFKLLGISQPLAVDKLLHVFNIEGYNIHTDSDIIGYNHNRN